MTSKNLNIAKSILPSDVHISKTDKEASKETLNKFIEEETKIVKGIFQCFESPGATQRIVVKKYPGIPMFEKTMTDGQIYEIPLYVARHLNGIDVTAKGLDGKLNTCSYPVHAFKWGAEEVAPKSQIGSGGIPVPIVGVSKRVKRYGFQSLEFAAA